MRLFPILLDRYYVCVCVMQRERIFTGPLNVYDFERFKMIMGMESVLVNKICLLYVITSTLVLAVEVNGHNV